MDIDDRSKDELGGPWRSGQTDWGAAASELGKTGDCVVLGRLERWKLEWNWRIWRLEKVTIGIQISYLYLELPVIAKTLHAGLVSCPMLAGYALTTDAKSDFAAAVITVHIHCTAGRKTGFWGLDLLLGQLRLAQIWLNHLAELS